MDRKQFLGSLVVIGAGAASAQTPPESPRPPFQQDWVKALMESMDASLDEAARIKVMEASGRACARRGAVDHLAKPAGGDLDKFVAAMAKGIGAENIKRDGSTIHLRYTKCFCPLVGAGPARLSDTYCHCSRGWVLEMFSTVAGKPVKVELLNSIKRGAATCDFTIRT